MPLANLDAFVGRLAPGSGNGPPELLVFQKNLRSGGATVVFGSNGNNSSMWLLDGVNWTRGAVPPTSATVPTKATVGALQFKNATGGRQKRLLTAFAWQSVRSSLWTIYDRLLHISGFSAIVTTAQAVGGSLTRYNTNATCIGNSIFYEVYGQIGTTVSSITANYINQDGIAAVTQPIQIGASNWRDIGTMVQMPLAVGDTGVLSVTDVTLTGTTGIAGDFGITIARKLKQFGVQLQSNGGIYRSGPFSFMPFVYDTACLGLMYQGSSSLTTPWAQGCVQLFEW